MGGSPIAEYTGIELVWHRMKWAVLRFRKRHIPYLVWHGQEVDVRVTFKEARLPEIEAGPLEAAFAEAVPHLMNGRLGGVRRDLQEIGIEFDAGIGPDGCDWEWDYSLRGPISVSFGGPAKRPELRA